MVPASAIAGFAAASAGEIARDAAQSAHAAANVIAKNAARRRPGPISLCDVSNPPPRLRAVHGLSLAIPYEERDRRSSRQAQTLSSPAARVMRI